jgi:hypothetical protein
LMAWLHRKRHVTPKIRFPEFQHRIEEMVEEGHSNPQIVAALKQLSFKISTRSLERYLQRWGRRRPAGTPGVRIGGVTDELAEKVNYLFHHATLNDDSIAARILSGNSLQTTGRQVRTIRLKFGWLRASTGPLKEANKAATQAQVAQLLDGPGRTFGKGWFVTYLRPTYPVTLLWYPLNGKKRPQELHRICPGRRITPARRYLPTHYFQRRRRR